MGQLLWANQITPERIEWLWPGYLPRGKVVLIDGDPGLGKSILLCELAARLSRGVELPGAQARPPANVYMLSLEDGQADTTVPRLLAAGADMGRVAVRESFTDEEGNDCLPNFPDDIQKLKDDLSLIAPDICFIDPIMRCLGEKVNSNNDQQLGRALMPLKLVAEELRCTIVLVRHLNKSTSQASLYRGQGGMAFVGVARTALLVALDPEDPSTRVLVVNKSNYRAGQALTYRVAPWEADPEVGRLHWVGWSSHTATTVLTPVEKDNDTAEAVAALIDILSEDEDYTRPAKEVERAAKEEGISSDRLRRAREKVGITRDSKWMHKAGGSDGAWHWILPPKYRPVATVAQNGHHPHADYDER